MNSVIYYFSGTGNSYKTALEISNRIGDCELVPIVAATKMESFKVDCKKVGFIFPLYYLGLPKVVLEFMEKVQIENADYVYAVVTRGWPLVGGAIKEMKRILQRKGKSLDLGVYIQMPQTDFTFAWVPRPEKQKEILGRFNKRIDQVIDHIKNENKKYDFEPISFMLDSNSGEFIAQVNSMDGQYTVNSSCNGCGLCAKICPVDNIQIVKGVPQWNHNCQMCVGCFHYCPMQAIEYGDKTVGKWRYHHPDISAQQIMVQKQV